MILDIKEIAAGFSAKALDLYYKRRHYGSIGNAGVLNQVCQKTRFIRIKLTRRIN